MWGANDARRLRAWIDISCDGMLPAPKRERERERGESEREESERMRRTANL